MGAVGYGPLWRIDGPLPLAPRRGLLQAATSEVVRIVPDVDASGIDRWGNGVEVYPYPVDVASGFDACASGSDIRTKEFGQDVPHPQFGALTVYLAETCSSYKVWDQAAFRARAIAALTAVEGTAVEREFLAGEFIPLNPHLADGNGTFPWGDTATSVSNGLAVLENEIAKSGREGVIHVSPAFAIAAAREWLMNMDETPGVIRTLNGTVVIPGTGYAAGHTPLGGHPAAGPTQEWIYASGPVDIRRSEIFVVPETVSEALERSAGAATTGRPNSITYRVERYYLVTWDTVVQSAVLVDRCSSDCGTPS